MAVAVGGKDRVDNGVVVVGGGGLGGECGERRSLANVKVLY